MAAQEEINNHCIHMLDIFEEFKAQYDRVSTPENPLKSLNKSVFDPVLKSPTNQFSPDQNNNYSPQQEAELVGFMRTFRNEIDCRLNLKAADTPTRAIHSQAMGAINNFSEQHKSDLIEKIEDNPSTLIKMQNLWKDKIGGSGSSPPSSPRNSAPG